MAAGSRPVQPPIVTVGVSVPACGSELAGGTGTVSVVDVVLAGAAADAAKVIPGEDAFDADTALSPLPHAMSTPLAKTMTAASGERDTTCNDSRSS
jgi:hypothetical protein